MKANKWVAVLATCSMLALAACSAPSNEETKVDVKDATTAVASVPVETNVSVAPPTPAPNCEQLKKSVSRLADDYSSYPEFRAQLIKLGWQPKAQGVLDGSELAFSRVRDLREAGFTEVERCYPTGRAQCIYHFVDARGNKLKVVGAGENIEGHHQVVDNTELSCSAPTPKLSTLAGRWVLVGESCAGDEGVSERMIEFDGRAMNSAFSSCEFPAAISSRSAYNGSMSCSDEEGGEHNSSVSIAIQQNGTLLWRDREGSSAYKKCSLAPRFPNE